MDNIKQWLTLGVGLIIVVMLGIQMCNGPVFTSFEVTPVTPENDNEQQGIRYYQPIPLLVVPENNESSKIIWMPNYSKAFAIEYEPGIFGSSAIEIELEQGWMLTSLNGKADQKGTNLITELGKISGNVFSQTDEMFLNAKTGKVEKNTSDSTVVSKLTAGIYRIVISDSSFKLVSLNISMN
ncbi:MAG: hypothetical protein ABJK11_11660 [Balneola sp.]